MEAKIKNFIFFAVKSTQYQIFFTRKYSFIQCPLRYAFRELNITFFKLILTIISTKPPLDNGFRMRNYIVYRHQLHRNFRIRKQ